MSSRARSTSLCLQNTLKVENQRITRRASSFRSCLKKNSHVDTSNETKDKDRDRRKSSCRCVMFSDEIGDNLVTSVFNYDEAEPAVINIEDLDNIDANDFPDDIELPDPFDDWNPPIIDEPEVTSESSEPPEEVNQNSKCERVAEIQELDPENEFVIPLDDSDDSVVNERLQIVFVKSDSDDEFVNVKVSKSCSAAATSLAKMSLAKTSLAKMSLAKMSGLRSGEASAVHGNPIKSLAGPQSAEQGDLAQSDRSADHFARNDCNDANGNIISEQIPQNYISSPDWKSGETDIDCPSSPSFMTPSSKISTYKPQQSPPSVHKSPPIKILSVQTSSHQILSVQKPLPNKILSVQTPTSDKILSVQKPTSDKIQSIQKLSPDETISIQKPSSDKVLSVEKAAGDIILSGLKLSPDNSKERSAKAQEEAIRCEGIGSKKVGETSREKVTEILREKVAETPKEKVVCARRVLVPARRRSAPSFQPPPPPNFAPPPLPSTPDAVASRRISLPTS